MGTFNENPFAKDTPVIPFPTERKRNRGTNVIVINVSSMRTNPNQRKKQNANWHIILILGSC